MSFLTNISALRTQRQLGRSTQALQESFTRLSSGLRINRASDDAAGLAIAGGLRTDALLRTQAIRNVNDGLSLLSIASGSLQSQRDIMVRMLELAEQSANGTLSNTQRGNLNAEYQALAREFGRIGDSTSFNGLKFLLGSRGSGAIKLQTGITGATTASLTFSAADTGTLSGTLDLTDVTYGFAEEAGASYEELSSFFNGKLYRTSVVDNSGIERQLLVGINANSAGYDGPSFSVSIYATIADTGSVGELTPYGAAIEVGDEWALAGYTRVSVAADGTATFSGSANLLFQKWGTQGSLSLSSAGLKIKYSGYTPTEESTAIDFTAVATVTDARQALTLGKKKLAELSRIIGDLGAVQSRLETSLSVSEITRENERSAESRIRDVDVAEEAAKLTATGIRQQAASAVLGLANQQPELLLRLLVDSS